MTLLRLVCVGAVTWDLPTASFQPSHIPPAAVADKEAREYRRRSQSISGRGSQRILTLPPLTSLDVEAAAARAGQALQATSKVVGGLRSSGSTSPGPQSHRPNIELRSASSKTSSTTTTAKASKRPMISAVAPSSCGSSSTGGGGGGGRLASVRRESLLSLRSDEESGGIDTDSRHFHVVTGDGPLANSTASTEHVRIEMTRTSSTTAKGGVRQSGRTLATVTAVATSRNDIERGHLRTRTATAPTAARVTTDDRTIASLQGQKAESAPAPSTAHRANCYSAEGGAFFRDLPSPGRMFPSAAAAAVALSSVSLCHTFVSDSSGSDDSHGHALMSPLPDIDATATAFGPADVSDNDNQGLQTRQHHHGESSIADIIGLGDRDCAASVNSSPPDSPRSDDDAAEKERIGDMDDHEIELAPTSGAALHAHGTTTLHHHHDHHMHTHQRNCMHARQDSSASAYSRADSASSAISDVTVALGDGEGDLHLHLQLAGGQL